MQPLIDAFAAKGDVAHIALMMWALAASWLVSRLFDALERAATRFDDFVREIARFNALFGDDE